MRANSSLGFSTRVDNRDLPPRGATPQPTRVVATPLHGRDVKNIVSGKMSPADVLRHLETRTPKAHPSLSRSRKASPSGDDALDEEARREHFRQLGHEYMLKTSAEVAEAVARRAAIDREREIRNSLVYQTDRFIALENECRRVAQHVPASGESALSTGDRSPSPDRSPRSTTFESTTGLISDASTVVSSKSRAAEAARAVLIPTRLMQHEIDALKIANPAGLEQRVAERHRALNGEDTKRYGLSVRSARQWQSKGIMKDAELEGYGSSEALLQSKAGVFRLLHDRDDLTRDAVSSSLSGWAQTALARLHHGDEFDIVLMELQESLKDRSKIPRDTIAELVKRLGVTDDDEDGGAGRLTQMFANLDPNDKGFVNVDALRAYWHRSELSNVKRAISLKKATELFDAEYPVVKQRNPTLERKPMPFHAFVSWMARMGAKLDAEDSAPLYASLQPLTRARALNDLFPQIQVLVQRIRSEQSESTSEYALARRLQDLEQKNVEATTAFENFSRSAESASTAQRRLDGIHSQLKQQVEAVTAAGRLGPVKVFYSTGTITDISIDDSFTELWESVIAQCRGGATTAMKGLPNALEMKEEKLQQALNQLRLTTRELVSARTSLESTTAKLRTAQRYHAAELDVKEAQIQVLQERVEELSTGAGVVFADPRFTAEVTEEVRESMSLLKARLRGQVADHSVAMHKVLKEVAHFRNLEEEAQQTIVVLKHRIDKIKSDTTVEIEGLMADVRGRDEQISELRAAVIDLDSRLAAYDRRLAEAHHDTADARAKAQHAEEHIERLLRMQKSLVHPDEVERRIAAAVSRLKLDLGAEAESKESMVTEVQQLRKDLTKEKTKVLDLQSKYETAVANDRIRQDAARQERDMLKELVRTVAAAWTDSVIEARVLLDRPREVADFIEEAKAAMEHCIGTALDTFKSLGGSGGALSDLFHPLKQRVSLEQSREYQTLVNPFEQSLLELDALYKDVVHERLVAVAKVASVQQEIAELVSDESRIMHAVHTLSADLEDIYRGSLQELKGWTPSVECDPEGFIDVAGPRWADVAKALATAVTQVHKCVVDLMIDADANAALAAETVAQSRAFEPQSPSERNVPTFSTQHSDAYNQLVDETRRVVTSLHESISKHESAGSKMLSVIIGSMNASAKSADDKKRNLRIAVDVKIRRVVLHARERVAKRWIERAERMALVDRVRAAMNAEATFDQCRADVLLRAAAATVELANGDTDLQAMVRSLTPSNAYLHGPAPVVVTALSLDSTPTSNAADGQPRGAKAKQRSAKAKPVQSGSSSKSKPSPASTQGQLSPDSSVSLPPAAVKRNGVAKPAVSKSEAAEQVLAAAQQRLLAVVEQRRKSSFATSAASSSNSLVPRATQSVGTQTRAPSNVPVHPLTAARQPSFVAVVTVNTACQTNAAVLDHRNSNAGEGASRSVSTQAMVIVASEECQTTEPFPSPPLVADLRGPTPNDGDRAPSLDDRSAVELLASLTGAAPHVLAFSVAAPPTPLATSHRGERAPGSSVASRLGTPVHRQQLSRKSTLAGVAASPKAASGSSTHERGLAPWSDTAPQSAIPSPVAAAAVPVRKASEAAMLPSSASAQHSQLPQPLIPQQHASPINLAASLTASPVAAAAPNSVAPTPMQQHKSSHASPVISGTPDGAHLMPPRPSSRPPTPKSFASLPGGRPSSANAPLPPIPQAVAASTPPAAAAITTANTSNDAATRVPPAVARFHRFLQRALYPLKKITLEMEDLFNRGWMPFEAIDALTAVLPTHYRVPGVKIVLLAMLCGLPRQNFVRGLLDEHFVHPYFSGPFPPTAAQLEHVFDAAVMIGELLLEGTMTHPLAPRGRSPQKDRPTVSTTIVPLSAESVARVPDTTAPELKTLHRASSASIRRPYSATGSVASSTDRVEVAAATADASVPLKPHQLATLGDGEHSQTPDELRTTQDTASRLAAAGREDSSAASPRPRAMLVSVTANVPTAKSQQESPSASVPALLGAITEQYQLLTANRRTLDGIHTAVAAAATRQAGPTLAAAATGGGGLAPLRAPSRGKVGLSGRPSTQQQQQQGSSSRPATRNM